MIHSDNGIYEILQSLYMTNCKHTILKQTNDMIWHKVRLIISFISLILYSSVTLSIMSIVFFEAILGAVARYSS